MNMPLDSRDDVSFTSAVPDSVLKGDKLFLQHSPLKTLLIMSIGPIMMLGSQSLVEFLDLYQITNRFKDEKGVNPVEIYGFLTSLFNLIMFVGSYFNQCINVYLPRLIGAGDKDIAAHVAVDLMRIAVIFMLIISAGIYFLVPPVVRFMGCPETMVKDCMRTFFIIVICEPISVTLSLAMGFTQGIGMSFMSGIFKVTEVIIQTGLFTPLFLFAFKVGPYLVKLSQVIAQSLCGVTFLVLIFAGKFLLKPNWRLLFGGFRKETLKALVIGIPMFLNSIVSLLPPTLILNFMTKLVDTDDAKRAISAVIAVFMRIQQVTIAVPNSIGMGFISVGSHSSGAKMYSRYLRLYYYTLGIAVGFAFVAMPFMIFKPEWIAGILISKPQEMKFAKKILPIPFYTECLNAYVLITCFFFVTQGKKIFAYIAPIVRITVLVSGSILFSKGKNVKPQKIMYVFCISDIIISIIYSIVATIHLVRLHKESKNESQYHSMILDSQTSIVQIH